MNTTRMLLVKGVRGSMVVVLRKAMTLREVCDMMCDTPCSTPITVCMSNGVAVVRVWPSY